MWTKMLKKKDVQKMFVEGTVRKKLWKIIHERNGTGCSQHRNEEIKFWAGGLNEKIHHHQFGSTYCNPLRTQEQSLRKLILSVSHPELGQVSPLTLGCLATKWDLFVLLYWLLDFTTWTKSFFQLSQYFNLQKALAGTSGLPSLPGNLSVSINRWMKQKVYSVYSASLENLD